jgi:hypothetical protein
LDVFKQKPAGRCSCCIHLHWPIDHRPNNIVNRLASLLDSDMLFSRVSNSAVDRELVARYRPGQPRKGLLVQLVDRIHRLQSIAAASRHDLPLPPLSAVAERVTFPFEIWRLVDVRWKELGYRSLSAYITGLIRYDLLVSGPHSSITADCRSKLQRKLTRKTLADRRKGRRRKILLDHLIEEAEGRPIPEQELERVKARIVKELRRISFSPGSAKMPAHTISFQREPIRTFSRGASTVKVERSKSEQYLYGAQRAIK